MSAIDFLDILIHIVFILLGVLAIVDYLRRRNGTRRDVALMFGILAIPLLLQLIARFNGEEVSGGAQTLSVIALVLELYLLLRLVRYLRSMPAYRGCINKKFTSWTLRASMARPFHLGIVTPLRRHA
jgi:hypothetical protein